MALAAGCAEPAVQLCEANCERRGECLGDVDVDQCRRACADGAPAGDEACVAAQNEQQRCLVAQPCEDYVAGTGCEAELAAVTSTCAP